MLQWGNQRKMGHKGLGKGKKINSHLSIHLSRHTPLLNLAPKDSSVKSSWCTSSSHQTLGIYFSIYWLESSPDVWWGGFVSAGASRSREGQRGEQFCQELHR